jgi:hypothetical protein
LPGMSVVFLVAARWLWRPCLWCCFIPVPPMSWQSIFARVGGGYRYLFSNTGIYRKPLPYSKEAEQHTYLHYPAEISELHTVHITRSACRTKGNRSEQWVLYLCTNTDDTEKHRESEADTEKTCLQKTTWAVNHRVADPGLHA